LLVPDVLGGSYYSTLMPGRIEHCDFGGAQTAILIDEGGASNLTVNDIYVRTPKAITVRGPLDNFAVRDVVHRPERRRKIGRNDSCSCGSGVKFKRCCGP
jgi:hypothetical protein